MYVTTGGCYYTDPVRGANRHTGDSCNTSYHEVRGAFHYHELNASRTSLQEGILSQMPADTRVTVATCGIPKFMRHLSITN